MKLRKNLKNANRGKEVFMAQTLAKETEKSSSIINFFLGKFPVKTYTKSVILNISFLFLCVFIAISLFDGYDFGKYEISNLDSPNQNPVGMWVFKIGFIISGFWFVPSVLNLGGRLAEFNRIIGKTIGIFYVFSGIGMVLVGFFPGYVSYPMHLVGAALGFGFLLLAIFLCYILFIVKIRREYSPRILLVGLLFYGPFFIVVVSGFIIVGLPFLNSVAEGIPWGEFHPPYYKNFEWAMFFTGLFSTIGTHFIYIPKDSAEN